MEASVTAYEIGGSKLDGSKIYMTEQEYELRGQNSSAELIFITGSWEMCAFISPLQRAARNGMRNY